MAIWTRQKEENLMRIIQTKKQLNEVKINGRKPDKLITRASEIGKMKVRDLRKLCSHDGQIIVDGKVFYDGKHGIK